MSVLSWILATRSYDTYLSSNNATFDAQSQVTSVGGGVYNILLSIGAFGAVAVLILTFMSIMMGNSAKKAEGKGSLITVLILVLLLASVGGIMSYVLQFGRDISF
jgi:hypothetical protein